MKSKKRQTVRRATVIALLLGLAVICAIALLEETQFQNAIDPASAVHACDPPGPTDIWRWWGPDPDPEEWDCDYLIHLEESP